ncbi:MAG TPA: biliverdin-producing heme oxygenase, partial [Chitinophagaceae bacterium]|nr:biliverdin-producing heme oxygenase [Chitinophagaceae bacterium]
LMISEDLKHATRASHAELEKLVIERIRRTNTAAGYLRLLEIFYGFYKPVEEQIGEFIDRTHFTDFHERRKSTALLHDMQQMEMNGSGRLCKDLPEISGAAQSLGALYVLEGSTLGGGIICKLLRKEMGESAPRTFLFFNGYGENTMDMWVKFKDRLNSYTEDAAINQQVMAAANQTFIKFKDWIFRYERNS